MRNKQVAIATLREVLNDRKTLERKLHDLLRDQGITEADAPYGFSIALTRLENFEDDIRNVLSELGEE